MKKLFIPLFLGLCAASANAQGVRGVPQTSPTPQKTDVKTTTTAGNASTLPKPAPAPQSFAAKYDGGLFGFSEKQKGTLNFDDVNERIVFRNKDKKEVFALPYKSFLVVYPDSRSVRSTAGTVGSVIPLPGASLLGLLKSKNSYLIVQFKDPDSDASGTASFKLDNKNLLRSVIYALGEKAELKQRGDAFYRPRQTEAQTL